MFTLLYRLVWSVLVSVLRWQYCFEVSLRTPLELVNSHQGWPHSLISSKCRLHSLSAHMLPLNSVISVSFFFSHMKSLFQSFLFLPSSLSPIHRCLIITSTMTDDDLKQRAWIICRCFFGLSDVSSVCCCVQHLWFLFTVWPVGGGDCFFFFFYQIRGRWHPTAELLRSAKAFLCVYYFFGLSVCMSV